MGNQQHYTIQGENASEISIAVKKPSSRYIDRLIKSRSGADLLASGVMPNTKEVTESYACLRAAEKMGEDMSDPSINVVCVGDGNTPRTAAVFAFNSAWQTHSVDPRLKHSGSHPHIHRLQQYQNVIENESLMFPGRTIVVACHSHASLIKSIQSIEAPSIGVISLACCVEDDLPIKPDYEYVDWACWSPARTVRIWKEVILLRQAA